MNAPATIHTVKIEPVPTGHVRCTLSTGATTTLDADKLGEWLEAHPLPPMSESPTLKWRAAMSNFFRLRWF